MRDDKFMIKTRKQLRNCIEKEKALYSKDNNKDNALLFMTNNHVLSIRKFVMLMRKSEYYYNNRKNPFSFMFYLFYERRKNTFGNKLGFYICNNTFEPGLQIFHHGSIIVNGYARIGADCKLHGDNCIGNDGTSMKAPVIGKNVDIGIGAKIIGDIYIADNVKIGAGAIVVKSCFKEGAILVGVPAKEIG